MQLFPPAGTYKVSWIVLELRNVHVAAVDCAADQGLLLPAAAFANLNHLRVH